MADGVAISAGAGTTILTDDTGAGGHAQVVKLAISTDGSGTLIPADATNGIDVDVTRVSGNVTVVGTGTLATQVDGSALTALQLIDDPVIADDAAFTIATSKVMMAGAAVVAHGAAPDAADAGDAGALLVNRNRVLFTIGGHPNLQSSEYLTSASVNDDNIMPALSAGSIYVITCVQVMVSAATTTNPAVRIGFGASTIPSAGASQADAVAKVVLSHPGMSPGSGIIKGNGSGIVGIGGDGEELRITTDAPTSGSIKVVVDWFSIPS